MKLSIALVFVSLGAQAAPLSGPQLQAIDQAANQTLRLTGVPAASIAVVKDGDIVAVRAYGMARLPAIAATTAMPFAIGSISKQFTSALILLLAQDGKLSLDDHVGRFLPELTQANDVTIRQILSHTAGYQDFWPEDYSPLIFHKPATPISYVDIWGKKKLDFPPGTAWQYSNTGYAIAGLIAEKAGGAPLFDQLRARILAPLGMKSAADYAYHGIPAGGPLGYERYAYGPPRPAPLDMPAWSFGSGGLAMTPHDLALWDISVINKSLLSAASYTALETEIKLKDGKGTGYALGVEIGTRNGHRMIEHSGEETGFVAENMVFSRRPCGRGGADQPGRLTCGGRDCQPGGADRVRHRPCPAERRGRCTGAFADGGAGSGAYRCGAFQCQCAIVFHAFGAGRLQGQPVGAWRTPGCARTRASGSGWDGVSRV